MAITETEIKGAVKEIVTEIVAVIMDPVLRLIQDDPHQWSIRPCQTCRGIGAIIGKPFGCYEYQRRRQEAARGGN